LAQAVLAAVVPMGFRRFRCSLRAPDEILVQSFRSRRLSIALLAVKAEVMRDCAGYVINTLLIEFDD
jgi:hypothetical protein